MIDVRLLDSPNWSIAMAGCRLSHNSSHRSDSLPGILGVNDRLLLERLIRSGTSHSKVLRTLSMSLQIDAPLYLWKHLDQYKVGVTTLSTSTMHTLHKLEKLEQSNFSTHIPTTALYTLNDYLNTYKRTKDKSTWHNLIGLLPSSFMQLRYWFGNYAVLRSILHQRKGHKLEDWAVFIEQVNECVPYFELLWINNEV